MATAVKSIFPLFSGLTTSSSVQDSVAYDYENEIFFWMTFTYQSLGAILGGQAAVAGDTFIMVMMLQICAQLEILIHRIQVFPKLCKKKFPNNPEMEQLFLSDWVKHHDSLYL